MLPVGGKPLAELAIIHAVQAGLFAVVTSDIDPILSATAKLGGLAVRRPAEYGNGDRHFESIRHAVETAVAIDPSKKGEPVVLLQPTSPFRVGNIIERCVAEYAKNPGRVVLSGRTIHYVDQAGKPVSGRVWDGCVAVYPQDKIGKPDDATIVENEHCNMLQVDTEEDYIQACIQHWRMSGHRMPINQAELKECAESLIPIVGGKPTTLVGRPDGAPFNQDAPVAWLNHCVGWDGGRADVLIVVASKNITKVGVNPELAEVAQKAKVVIVRDFGQGEWLKENLKVGGKLIHVKSGKVQVSTGTFACAVLAACGAKVETVGFQRGISRIPYCTYTFPEALASEEIAMLEVFSKERQIPKE